MAIPAGVTAATVTVKAAKTAASSPINHVVTIRPNVQLFHATSGAELASMIEPQTTDTLAIPTFILPHSDQSGFVDASGAAVQNWHYIAEVQQVRTFDGKPAAATGFLRFELPAGTVLADIQNLSVGSTAEDRPVAAFDRTRSYDPRLNVYNLKPASLRRARAAMAKARAGTGFARIATIGESTTAGQGAGTAGSKSWPARLRSILGTYGAPSAGTGLVGGWRADQATDPRWVLNGNWGARDGASNFITNYAGGDTTTTAVFTSDTPGTIARLYYGGNTSAFQVSLDGGAFTAVNPSTGPQVEVKEWTGLANTTHSIAVRKSGGPPEILGAEVRSNATSGVLLYNAGISGNQVEVAAVTEWIGVTQTTTASTAFAADLVFLMYGINDANAGISLGNFRARYQAAINNIRASGADLVLLTSSPAAAGSPLDPYMGVIYELARINDLPLIDLIDRMGTFAQANANGLMTDAFHPSAAGYSDIAHTIYEALRL